MNINKRLLLIFVIYIIGIAGFSGYKAVKGGENYFNYKSEVNRSKELLKNETKSDKGQNKDETVSDEKDKSNVATSNTSQPAANNATSDSTANNVAGQKEEDYSKVTFSKVLGLGSMGEDVKKLQYLLKNKTYYKGDITGNFDAATKQALSNFQRDNKLPADGDLGKITWTKLEQ